LKVEKESKNKDNAEMQSSQRRKKRNKSAIQENGVPGKPKSRVPSRLRVNPSWLPANPRAESLRGSG